MFFYVFKMNTISDYHNLYLKTDVLLLVVLEKIIKTCSDYYGLDPCHYFINVKYDWNKIRPYFRY